MSVTPNPDEWAVHRSPAWGDRVDFVANAKFDGSGPGTLGCEQLLFQRAGDGRYRLCCIPFFTYGYSLGDVVTLEDHGEVGLAPGEVVERSDHWSIRVLVTQDADVTAFRTLLRTHEAEVEMLGRLVACSVVGEERMLDLRRELDQLEREGVLEYETVWT
ncbi:DUF4265 domain-containing protein [Curtobacterium sp. VKM Ac-2922]|uniref:DUF4265 domain-containing protein n=1 Tax=Curtobacterium sp. VKM Ac-2922 TaxID=2929475 RepID=UPI001FB1C2D0|nr:DUF4265 domain-containing protein [Curtobacterium sp. VKM Ac-2922]MCJ1712892.1 DUF4265 domain-containing protein [Curtobacterium sp. VKM Ac-2922]